MEVSKGQDQYFNPWVAALKEQNSTLGQSRPVQQSPLCSEEEGQKILSLPKHSVVQYAVSSVKTGFDATFYTVQTVHNSNITLIINYSSF